MPWVIPIRVSPLLRVINNIYSNEHKITINIKVSQQNHIFQFVSSRSEFTKRNSGIFKRHLFPFNSRQLIWLELPNGHDFDNFFDHIYLMLHSLACHSSFITRLKITLTKVNNTKILYLYILLLLEAFYIQHWLLKLFLGKSMFLMHHFKN